MAASQTAPAAEVVQSGAFGPGSESGEREDLSDQINRIDPDNVPVYANARKGVSKAILHDWLVQELKAPPDLADRAQPEGFEATVTAHVAPVRHSNATQVFADTKAVSDTIDNVDKAGRDSELTYQKLLTGLELRIQVDATMTDAQISSGLDTTRTMATIQAWMTNGNVASDGTMPSGDGSDIPVVGTPEALALANIEGGMQDAYEDGGSPRILYMSPKQKAAFSDLQVGTWDAVIPNEYTMSSVKEGVYIGAVSTFLTDFGRIECVIDRHMPTNVVLGIDPNYMKMCAVPGLDFHAVDLAKTGANKKFYVSYEGTLEMGAPKAHFMVGSLS